MQKSKNIKALDDFIKIYNKQKQLEENLLLAKSEAIKYLQNNNLENIKYKNKNFSLCTKKTFQYSQFVIEMAEACSKQKRIEELTGDAKIKSTTPYIRLSEAKNANK